MHRSQPRTEATGIKLENKFEVLGALQTQKFAKPKPKKQCAALPRVAPSGGADKGGGGEMERVLEAAKEKWNEQRKKNTQRHNGQAEDGMHDKAIGGDNLFADFQPCEMGPRSREPCNFGSWTATPCPDQCRRVILHTQDNQSITCNAVPILPPSRS